MNKENNNKMYVKIHILLSYGKENYGLIIDSLNTENSEEKLDIIPKIIASSLKSEQKIFVIQKLLSLPKITRKVIAKKFEDKINEDNN